MRVKLLAPHFIDARYWETNSVLDVTSVSPLMEGLDPEAVAAIAAENIRVYGRWTDEGVLLDNPPRIRTLDNNRPVLPIITGGPPQ